jgi:hypothetical protein
MNDICYSSKLEVMCVRLCVLVHVCVMVFVGKKKIFFFRGKVTVVQIFPLYFFHRTRVAGILLSR